MSDEQQGDTGSGGELANIKGKCFASEKVLKSRAAMLPDMMSLQQQTLVA